MAKGAGHNAFVIYERSMCFEGIIPCKQSALGRACFAGFAAVFSFTLAPARRSRRPPHPTRLNLVIIGKDGY
jgi:hypothetical protein